jgi:hypothetical protein
MSAFGDKQQWVRPCPNARQLEKGIEHDAVLVVHVQNAAAVQIEVHAGVLEEVRMMAAPVHERDRPIRHAGNRPRPVAAIRMGREGQGLFAPPAAA